MSKFITGLFENSDRAGKAIAELKERDLTEQLSVIAKDEESGKINTDTVEGDDMSGTKGGAIAGAAIGGLGALAIGATSVTLPGLGLIAAGPLATALAGAAGGAVTGGLVGALVDEGLSEDDAKDFESDVRAGQVMAAIKADEDDAGEIEEILKSHGAKRVQMYET